jgi:hypothetical protein
MSFPSGMKWSAAIQFSEYFNNVILNLFQDLNTKMLTCLPAGRNKFSMTMLFFLNDTP